MYSSKIVEKTFVTESGDKILYEAKKLNVTNTGKESFKILRCVLPSAGVGLDNLFQEDNGMFEMPRTLAEMFTLLSDNLTEDHFEDLSGKLFGGLRINDKKVDIDEHFETYPEHYIPVLIWLGEETFSPFLTRNSMFRSMKEKIKLNLAKVQETLKGNENSYKDNVTEDNEK